MDAVSIRGEWVGRIIDGRFPLLEWLGGSSTGGVFRTELDGSAPQRAAIKLMPGSAWAEDRLAAWSSATSLWHPHLMRILHFGRAEIDETKLVYIVTDFAEEVLAQIIPERALSADETRQMLDPVLDALHYLHGKGYIHGHLKPANIMVVDDQVKLSSEGLLRVDSVAPELLVNDVHIAPETADGPVARPADIWSLGVTLVETLTQEPPIWDAAADGEPIVPPSVPEPFASIARECLHPDPSRRCTLKDIKAALEGRQMPIAPPAPPPPQPSLGDQPISSPQRALNSRGDKPVPSKIPLLPLIIGFILLVAIIIALGMRSQKTRTDPAEPATGQQGIPTPPDSKPPPESEAPASLPSPASPVVPSMNRSSKGEILSRSLPDVPHQASNTIHGTVGVAVRVSVDTTGSVTQAEFASHGPSAYFARLALESARNWKFKAPQQDGRAVSSAWVLHYAFRRDGVDVRPEKSGP